MKEFEVQSLETLQMFETKNIKIIIVMTIQRIVFKEDLSKSEKHIESLNTKITMCLQGTLHYMTVRLYCSSREGVRLKEDPSSSAKSHGDRSPCKTLFVYGMRVVFRKTSALGTTWSKRLLSTFGIRQRAKAMQLIKMK